MLLQLAGSNILAEDFKSFICKGFYDFDDVGVGLDI